MPPRRTFAEGLEFGRRGERLVEAWLQSIGIATMPAYDFAGQGAPEMRRAEWRTPVPDILGMRKARSFWFEVKTHTQAIPNRRRGCKVHGVKARLFRGYKVISAEAGMPVYLLILELDTCALLSARIDLLETWSCECWQCQSGKENACLGKRLVYFRRDAMVKVHSFSRAECDGVAQSEAA